MTGWDAASTQVERRWVFTADGAEAHVWKSERQGWMWAVGYSRNGLAMTTGYAENQAEAIAEAEDALRRLVGEQ